MNNETRERALQNYACVNLREVVILADAENAGLKAPEGQSGMRSRKEGGAMRELLVARFMALQARLYSRRSQPSTKFN